jgi:hypothetical protein
VGIEPTREFTEGEADVLLVENILDRALIEKIAERELLGIPEQIDLVTHKMACILGH